MEGGFAGDSRLDSIEPCGWPDSTIGVGLQLGQRVRFLVNSCHLVIRPHGALVPTSRSDTPACAAETAHRKSAIGGPEWACDPSDSTTAVSLHLTNKE